MLDMRQTVLQQVASIPPGFVHAVLGGLQQLPNRHSTVGTGQALPQLPQLNESVCRFLQLPLQQVCPSAHAEPHVPQLAPSVCRSLQLPPQQLCPAGQAEPQVPQWAASVCRSRQLPEQSVKPPRQTQLPAWHVPPPGALQTVPFVSFLHLPGLQFFLPFFSFLQFPFWQN
jgi:hypothetical protein